MMATPISKAFDHSFEYVSHRQQELFPAEYTSSSKYETVTVTFPPESERAWSDTLSRTGDWIMKIGLCSPKMDGDSR